MGEVISTIFDPLGFGFGKLITGKDSALLNVDTLYGNKVGDKNKGSSSAPGINTPTPPNQGAADQAAQDKINSSRRALLLSGGDTTLTGIGGAPLLSGETSSKVLLGGA